MIRFVVRPNLDIGAYKDTFQGDRGRQDQLVVQFVSGKISPESYVRRYFKAMFEDELYSWYTDPDLWPKDLSFKTFKKFFTIHVSTMVFDLGKGMIEREED